MDRANHGVRDAQHVTTKALPNGAATVYSSGFDLGLFSARGARMEECELQISAPALTTAELPNAETMTYDVQSDSAVGFGTVATIATAVLTQTGAGGVGAAAATARFRFPSDCAQYIRVAATNSGAGDASGKDMTVEILY